MCKGSWWWDGGERVRVVEHLRSIQVVAVVCVVCVWCVCVCVCVVCVCGAYMWC